ncbi:MAG: DUF1003 domain-containing protein [Cyclobacteriaceae bacterium]|jgi:uncharacterized membrane protein
MKKEKFVSDLSQKEYPINSRVSGQSIRQSLFDFIQKDNPQFTRDHCLSNSELNHYREQYISNYLIKEMGELTELEKTVLESITSKTTITDKVDDDEQANPTLGQRVADKVATFGGSWTFIISFGVFLILWISLNVVWLANKGFDPFPFILLNLILSCIAAMQAPVIMMSQNRQEEKDRERAKKDYMINLKSELEIRILHEKIDHMIMHQQQNLLEIQKVQIEMMNDILERVEKK